MTSHIEFHTHMTNTKAHIHVRFSIITLRFVYKPFNAFQPIGFGRNVPAFSILNQAEQRTQG